MTTYTHCTGHMTITTYNSLCQTEIKVVQNGINTIVRFNTPIVHEPINKNDINSNLTYSKCESRKHKDINTHKNVKKCIDGKYRCKNCRKIKNDLFFGSIKCESKNHKDANLHKNVRIY